MKNAKCKNLTVFASAGLLSFALLLEGCTGDLKGMEEEILAHDSSFQKTIDQRDSTQRQLDADKASYIQKNQEIESRMTALKEKKAEIKADHLATLEKIKRQIYPKKRSLQQDLMNLQRRLKEKQIEVRNITKDIDEVNALVKKDDRLSLTREEIQAWSKRLSTLVERKNRMEKEIAALRKKIRITRLKIKVLDVR